MRRYYHLPLLQRKEAGDVPDMAYVAFLSLEECGLIPQNLSDVTEHIYDILKGEAWAYIQVYRPDILRLLKDWETRKTQFAEEARALREKQEEEYACALSLDKKERYVFRHGGKRFCVQLHTATTVRTLLTNISVSITSKSYVFTSYDTRIVVNDIDFSLAHYVLKPNTVYDVEEGEVLEEM